MLPYMNLERLLTERLAPAYEAVAGEPVDPSVRRSRYGDFQSDAALARARRTGRAPRELAADVVRAAELDDLCSAVEVSGPGFVNLTVSDDALDRLIDALAQDDRLGVPAVCEPETVVLDYSGPNVAKEMHVGHLRSTVIGDAAYRLLDWLGHRVVKANHLGDWGTPFGMLIEHLLDVGEDEAAHELSVGDLDEFYKAARRKFDADEAFRERSRRRVVALQSGDELTGRLWRLLVEQSQRYFLVVYEKLGVALTDRDFSGESDYNDRLGAVVDELGERGLLRESDGAQCVFPRGFTGRDGEPLPLIVRKRDGGYGYPATDLAAIRYRLRELAATRLLYVHGLTQRRHFEMVFAVAREAGWFGPASTATLVGFGSVLGAGGKMLRSRAGDSVKLVEMLDEAVSRAAEVSGPEVARAVGIGAVKYADLSNDRVRDYVFDWGRMLALVGDTSVYLQYAHARVRSIFATAGAVEPGEPVWQPIQPYEHALAVELSGFAPVVEQVAESLEFHRLTAYLHGVATAFSRFFEHCPVLQSGAAVRRRRLRLCDVTARTLHTGLWLLGIEAPAPM